MSTYAENSRDTALKARKARQDIAIAHDRAAFNADVAANTDKRGGWKRMKYERASFSVVTASDAFREGWDRIFGRENETGTSVASAKPAPSAGTETDKRSDS